jgi:hypothetical protein
MKLKKKILKRILPHVFLDGTKISLKKLERHSHYFMKFFVWGFVIYVKFKKSPLHEGKHIFKQCIKNIYKFVLISNLYLLMKYS